MFGSRRKRSKTHDPAEIERWLQKKIAQELGVPAESVDPSEPIMSHGIDSIAGFTMTVDLADWLGRELSADLLWEYPTIVELAAHLGQPESGEH